MGAVVWIPRPVGRIHDTDNAFVDRSHRVHLIPGEKIKPPLWRVAAPLVYPELTDRNKTPEEQVIEDVKVFS